MVEHGLEVLGIDEEKTVVIRDLEHDRQNVGLQLIELHDARQKKRSHLRDRSPELDAVLAVYIPESHGIPLIEKSVLFQVESLDPGLHILTVNTGRHHSGQIPLDVRKEYRDSHFAESLGHNSECYRFAGTGSSGNKTMPVCFSGQKTDLFVGIIECHPNFTILKHFFTPVNESQIDSFVYEITNYFLFLISFSLFLSSFMYFFFCL